MRCSLLLASCLSITLGLAPELEARDQIRIVGASTVFPLATAVAKQFGQTSGFATPVVESTGSDGGLKLFCAGVGEEHPDMTNTSRAIKDSELETCASNGVQGITEIKVGFDGIVLANSKAAESLDVTIPQIFQALAAEVEIDGVILANPYISWREIDPALPDAKIEVLGPPLTSGIHDAFVELIMKTGCQEFPAIAALKDTDEDKFEAVCATMREDGAFVEVGENDNLIVQKIEANPAAFGIFGFSFLNQNQDKLQGNYVDGVKPTFENIAAGDYPVSRSLYLYVKHAHIGVIPGIQEYVTEFTSETAFGEHGYLADKGLIPMPKEDRRNVREVASRPMDKRRLGASDHQGF